MSSEQPNRELSPREVIEEVERRAGLVLGVAFGLIAAAMLVWVVYHQFDYDLAAIALFGSTSLVFAVFAGLFVYSCLKGGGK